MKRNYSCDTDTSYDCVLSGFATGCALSTRVKVLTRPRAVTAAELGSSEPGWTFTYEWCAAFTGLVFSYEREVVSMGTAYVVSGLSTVTVRAWPEENGRA